MSSSYRCSLFFVAAVLNASLVSAAWLTPNPNVRERHDNALYLNVPVKSEDMAKLLLPPLVPDEFDGNAWVSVVVDGLNKLEKWVPGLGFVDTHTSGWMIKVNLMVKDSNTNQSGYLITSIAFEQGFSGFVRSTGAIWTQKIPSSQGRFDVQVNATHFSANVDLEAASKWDVPSAMVNLTAELPPPAANASDFAKFIIQRPVKYLQQFKGDVVCSPELGEGADFDLSGVQALQIKNLDWDFLRRLSLTPVEGWEPCQENTCLLQPVYVIVDHQNIELPCTSGANESGA